MDEYYQLLIEEVMELEGQVKIFSSGDTVLTILYPELSTANPNILDEYTTTHSSFVSEQVNPLKERLIMLLVIGCIGVVGFIFAMHIICTTKHLKATYTFWYLQQMLLANFILLILLPFMALTDGNGNSSLVVANVKNIIRTLFYLGFFSSLQFHVVLSVGQFASGRRYWKWRLNQAKLIISVTIAVWLVAITFSIPILYADSSKPIQTAFFMYMAISANISLFVTMVARSLLCQQIRQVKRVNDVEIENGKFHETKVNKMNDKINMNKVDHEGIFEVKERETDQKTKKENGEKDKIARLEYALLKASTGISISFFIAWMAFMIIGLIINRDNFLLLNYSDYTAAEYAGLIIIYINKVIGIYIYILAVKLIANNKYRNCGNVIESNAFFE